MNLRLPLRVSVSHDGRHVDLYDGLDEHLSEWNDVAVAREFARVVNEAARSSPDAPPPRSPTPTGDAIDRDAALRAAAAQYDAEAGAVDAEVGR